MCSSFWFYSNPNTVIGSLTTVMVHFIDCSLKMILCWSLSQAWDFSHSLLLCEPDSPLSQRSDLFVLRVYCWQIVYEFIIFRFPWQIYSVVTSHVPILFPVIFTTFIQVKSETGYCMGWHTASHRIIQTWRQFRATFYPSACVWEETGRKPTKHTHAHNTERIQCYLLHHHSVLIPELPPHAI